MEISVSYFERNYFQKTQNSIGTIGILRWLKRRESEMVGLLGFSQKNAGKVQVIRQKRMAKGTRTSYSSHLTFLTTAIRGRGAEIIAIRIVSRTMLSVEFGRVRGPDN